jgi:thiol-disulfide isomerase/thioredoxin
MKGIFCVFFVVGIVFTSIGVAQHRVVIEAEIKVNSEDSIIEMSAIPIDHIYLEDRVTKQSEKRDSVLRFTFDVSRCISIYSKKLLGRSVYFAEPGDSIRLKYFGGKIFFSGKGAEKFQIIYETEQHGRGIPMKDMEIETTSINEFLESYSSMLGEIGRRKLLLDKYRSQISPIALSYIEAKLISELENNFNRKFLYLYFNKRRLNISNADLAELFEKTISHSHTLTLAQDSMSLSDNIRSFLFNYTRAEYAYVNNFKEYTEELRRECVIGWYDIVGKKYKGFVREKLLTYILCSWMIKRVGFVPEVEDVLVKYYETPNYPQYKKWVHEYESAARTLVKGKPAPDFVLKDTSNRDFFSGTLKGKVILIDFWFTGCQGCIQMTRELRKIKRHFDTIPNVVFLSISVDKERVKWLKSIKNNRYALSESINLFTGGLGIDHYIVKRFNISSYPKLYLIDQYGRIVDNPLPDPRQDEGIKLIDIIRSQVVKGNDGPYLLYKGKSVIAKRITTDSGILAIKVDSTSLAKKDDFTFPVQTDKLFSTFNVQLKKELKDEPSEFRNVEKMMVISDIEGNFGAFRKLLQANNIIDAHFNWTFGDGHLVLGGDFFDRGEQVTECLWLIYSLEEKAKRSGGYIHFILGNHEIMNIRSDVRYNSSKYLNSSELLGTNSEGLYGDNSELGKWLRTKNIIEKIDDILFTHGGISKAVNDLNLSLTGINQLARRNYSYFIQEPPDSVLISLFSGKTSPFWYRGYYGESGKSNKELPNQIDTTLNKFDVGLIVTGHTIVSDTVSIHFNGKVVNTDTNHAFGKSEGLLIEDGCFYRVDLTGERIFLFRKKREYERLVGQ